MVIDRKHVSLVRHGFFLLRRKRQQQQCFSGGFFTRFILRVGCDGGRERRPRGSANEHAVCSVDAPNGLAADVSAEPRSADDGTQMALRSVRGTGFARPVRRFHIRCFLPSRRVFRVFTSVLNLYGRDICRPEISRPRADFE